MIGSEATKRKSLNQMKRKGLCKIIIRSWNRNILLDIWMTGESIGTLLSFCLRSIIVFRCPWMLLLNHRYFREVSLSWVIIWLTFAFISISLYPLELHTRIHTQVMRYTMDGWSLRITSSVDLSLISSQPFPLTRLLVFCFLNGWQVIHRKRSTRLFLA